MTDSVVCPYCGCESFDDVECDNCHFIFEGKDFEAQDRIGNFKFELRIGGER